MAERLIIDATGQAHIEGEPDLTVYAWGVYPSRMPLTDAIMLTRPLPIPIAFVNNFDLEAVP